MSFFAEAKNRVSSGFQSTKGYVMQKASDIKSFVGDEGYYSSPERGLEVTGRATRSKAKEGFLKRVGRTSEEEAQRVKRGSIAVAEATLTVVGGVATVGAIRSVGIGVASKQIAKTALAGEIARRAPLEYQKRTSSFGGDSKLIEQATYKGFESEAKEVSQRGSLSKIGYEITSFWGSDEAFKSGAEEFLKAKGLTGNQLDVALKETQRRNIASGTGEVLGHLTISASTEIQTRRVLGKATIGMRGTGELAKASVAPLFVGGLSEGASSVSIQQMTRTGKFDPKDVAVGALAGGASATAIGVPISAFTYSRPKVSKVIEKFSYIIDPYEKAGDVLADVTTRGRRGFSRVITTNPTVLSPEGVSKRKTKSVVGTPVPDAVPPTPTSSSVPTTTNVPVSVATNVPVNVSQTVPVSVTTPTSVPTSTPIIGRGVSPFSLPSFSKEKKSAPFGFFKSRKTKTLREIVFGI